jgi:RimJ/RimL family protein N-acetyltransferase/catechol 2,3-dioxygenase-like lactoylglutathione lyase family enzyme
MAGDVLLREVREGDLPIFFEQQLDPAANYMAAFTAKDPADWEAFTTHWTRIRGDDRITIRTILFEARVAGYVASFERFGEPEVSYWIGKEYWGQGIATRALSEFLRHVPVRPLYARVAKDNAASIRVLKKCGFSVSGEDKGFSNARGEEVEELVLVLRAMRRGVLHHQILVVSDASRSARFYAPVLRFLGYECTASSPCYQDWRLITDGAPHEISFISVAPALRDIRHVRGAVGQHHHFAWTAASPQEVDLFFESVLVPLAATGDCTVLDPPALFPEYSPTYYAVFFEDPDGLKFELVYNPPTQR